MYKAFISHRSTHKALAENVVNAVGRDFCWLDKFDIEPAARTIEAVMQGLGECPIFVLLLSKDALESSWVNTEMRRARELYDERAVRCFMVFLVDEDMTYNDAPQWMRDDKVCFNLKVVTSPVIIANLIKSKQRKLAREDEGMSLGDHMFIGRSEQLDIFQREFTGGTAPRRSLIASGIKGVGRGCFLRKCMEEAKLADKDDDGFCVNLQPSNDIEDFLLQLHKGLGYTEEKWQQVLHLSYGAKITQAITYISKIINSSTYLVIDDNQCCVSYDHKLADWFCKILEREDAPQTLKVLVKSRVRLNASDEYAHPRLIHVSIPPMIEKERRRLFNSLCNEYQMPEPCRKEVDFFVSHVTHSPRQMADAVLAMKRSNIREAKELVKNFQSQTDGNIKESIAAFDSNPDAQNLFALFCETTMLSYDTIEVLFPQEYEYTYFPLVEKMKALCILSAFGFSGEYLVIDADVADYLRRCNIASMSKELAAKLKNAVSRNVKEVCLDDFSDMPIFLYNLRKGLLTGKQTDTALLMPSAVISAITRLYEEGDTQNFKAVVELCEKALQMSDSFSSQVVQDIRFKQCQAYCRLCDEYYFWQKVNYIEDKANREFLIGFFFRLTRKHDQALEHLSIALSMNKNMQTAQREIVNVYIDLGKFSDALPIAKENYGRMRFPNPFHIHAYFRSLLHTSVPTPSKETHGQLRGLLTEMEVVNSRRKKEMLEAMRLEYDLFGKNWGEAECAKRISQLPAELKGLPAIADVLRLYHIRKN